MEQHCYLVTYDVSDPKRWRKVFRTLNGFGDHLQLSVFRCDLTETRLVHLRAALERHIHQREDSVILARIGPTSRETLDKIEVLGRSPALSLPGPKVI